MDEEIKSELELWQNASLRDQEKFNRRLQMNENLVRAACFAVGFGIAAILAALGIIS